MKHPSEKNTKHVSSAQEAQYDVEITRKAKETYRAFASKVAANNAAQNTVLTYPIHWQFASPVITTPKYEGGQVISN